MASYQKALDEDQEHRRLEVEHFDLKERRQKRQREDEAHELRTRLRQQGHRTAEQQYADLKAAKVVHDRLEAEAAAARDAYMASQGERMLDQVLASFVVSDSAYSSRLASLDTARQQDRGPRERTYDTFR